MKEKYINQKFKSSMLSAATKTLGFRDMQTDKLYNLAIIHIPNQDDKYFEIGKQQDNEPFLNAFYEQFAIDKTQKVLSHRIARNIHRKVPIMAWEWVYGTVDEYLEQAIEKYGDIPICVIFHEAWNTYEPTISIYVLH